MNYVDVKIFGDLKPEKVLIYYDGPLSYTMRGRKRLFYVHWIDENHECTSEIARSINPSQMDDLESNKIDLRSFILEGKPLYLIKRYFHTNKIEAFEINPETINDCLPNPGVFLDLQRDDDNVNHNENN